MTAEKFEKRNISYSINGYPTNASEVTPEIFEKVVKKAFDVSND